MKSSQIQKVKSLSYQHPSLAAEQVLLHWMDLKDRYTLSVNEMHLEDA